MATLMNAHNEWASRPDDERFTDLHSMDRHYRRLADRSWSAQVSSRDIQFSPSKPDEMRGLTVSLGGKFDEMRGLTHWSFGQMAGLAGAPAGYLRGLPAPLAADNLNYGMRFRREPEAVKVLLTEDAGTVSVRAATGPSYGRVWNGDITSELIRRFGDGRTGDWRVPGEFGKEVPITKDNTTLYGSDRDMFVFLADEKNRIEVPGRRNGEAGQMARGFFVWNSEVGDRTLGIAFFLFDFVCSNRIVWGAQQYSERKIRHSITAPDRWAEEVLPIVAEFSASSARPIEETIRAAQTCRLDDAQEFLTKRFSARLAGLFNAQHEAEEGRPIESIWDATTAITAFAREKPHNDDRVELERKGGALLDLAAA